MARNLLAPGSGQFRNFRAASLQINIHFDDTLHIQGWQPNLLVNYDRYVRIQHITAVCSSLLAISRSRPCVGDQDAVACSLIDLLRRQPQWRDDYVE
jgi:hypothetical protein